jgi:hypothetical protein
VGGRREAAAGVSRSGTRYARSGELNIAYQVVGEGPLDLVYVPGFVSNVELMWEEPGYAAFLDRLATFSRLIIFDNGEPVSDPCPTTLSHLEERRTTSAPSWMRSVPNAPRCSATRRAGT